ncbi:hypothetical protein I5U65_02345 [Stenotrophomonas maltophilia]|nr:hypothetical protein [Stenotrophomonas maltophilia]
MTDLHSRCNSKLNQILKAFEDATAIAGAAVREAKVALKSIPDTQLRPVAQLLEDSLISYKDDLITARTNRKNLRYEVLWKRIWGRRKVQKAVDDAKTALRSKRQYELSDDAVRAREADCNQRAAEHAAHTSCSKALHEAVNNLQRRAQEEQHLQQFCEPLRESFARRAWLAGNTEDLLDRSVEDTQAHAWASAAKWIQEIGFQRLPSEDQFEQWKAEHRNILREMRKQGAGFVATAAHPGLLVPSLALAKTCFHPSVWVKSVGRIEELPDRWYELPVRVIHREALIEPVQWIIYWAFLNQSQRFAVDTGMVTAHEDVLTGMLTYALKGELEWSAKGRLFQLGYPRVTANIDILQLAGMNGEFETGADIGLIIHLDVGDLNVHKAALLQAKVSSSNSAELGSSPSGSKKMTQLQKLHDAERDFYLFYHKSRGISPAILPTVTAVNHFVAKHKMTADDLLKENKSVKTREHGWDLASFAAFGLCSPKNAIGKDIPVGGSSLDAITDNGRSTLPIYMMVVSLSHDDSEYQKVITPLHEKGYRTVPDPDRENVPSSTADARYRGG